MFLLLLADASVVFGAIVAAVYLRLGTEEGYLELSQRHGFLKALLATSFCLIAFYLFDLYDFDVMHKRLEPILRLVQALGFAWIALALCFFSLSPTNAAPRYSPHSPDIGSDTHD